MAKNAARYSEILVGLFVTVVLALLAYFTIAVSGIDLLNGSGKVSRTVVFDNIAGLKLRDSIVMRGLAVGTVEKLRVKGSGVEVVMGIPGDIKLHEGCRVEIQATSLLGGSVLSITDGDGAELPNDAVISGISPNNWMRDLSETIAGLKQSLSGNELRSAVTNISNAAASLSEVARRIENGEGMLGKLLSPDDTMYSNFLVTAENLRSITDKINIGTNSIGRILNDAGNVYDGLGRTVANLDRITSRLERGEGTVGRLLSSDDALYKDLSAAIASLREVGARLEQGQGTLGKLLSGDERMYNDLAQATENLKIVTERLSKGEGTLGKLSADDELYTDIKGLVQDVRQTVDNYRDTTPITAFASLLMGGL
jgi:phospholipid/cholesterol/gamma-HCH transport system substrate-binding protein